MSESKPTAIRRSKTTTDEEAVMRRVGLYHDGDSEWTYIDYNPEPAADEADDEDHRFVVTVPEALVMELQATELANQQARAAIFDAAGFDPDLGEFTEVCEAWVGDEPAPRRPFWDVVYRASGSPDEWPVGDYPARMTSFDTEEEAVAAIASMPEEFLIHHHGLKLQLLRRDRLMVQQHPGWGGYRSRCHRCGHDFGEHAADNAGAEAS